MKDYDINLNRCGITGKKRVQGHFFPAGGGWDIEDFEKGIELMEYGIWWYRENIARLKKRKLAIQKEIEEIAGE